MKPTLVACVASLVFLSGVLPRAAVAQTSLPTDAEIRQVLVDRVDVQRRHVGIVVGIVTPHDRRVIAYGRFSRDNLRPLDGATVFEIGSVTKVFTSLLLADMARRGEVSLTDPVAKYLPAGVTVGSNNDRTIRLVDLATHTSALPFWPSNVPASREGALSMATYSIDQLYQFLSSFEVPDSVGTTWAYSNVDAGLLGLALGRRAGSSYDALLSATVIGPLAMTSTAVTVSPAMKAQLAVGHDAKLEVAPPWDVPTLAGAGSLHSSANDLMTFLGSLGNGHSPTAAAMTTMLETRRAGPGFQQALGWWVFASPSGDDEILAHDGGTLGFASSVAYDPKTRTGIVVLTNSAARVGDIARHLLRPVFPLTKPSGTAPVKTEIRLDPTLFDRYVGRYEPAPGVGFVVTRDGDALMIELPSLPKLRLRPESGRQFFIAEDTRVSVTFDVDPAGQVTRLLLKAPTGDVPATRVPSIGR